MARRPVPTLRVVSYWQPGGEVEGKCAARPLSIDAMKMTQRRIADMSEGAAAQSGAGIRPAAQGGAQTKSPAPSQDAERARMMAAYQVRMGLIGCGAQGVALLDALQSAFGAQVAAVSDLYSGHLDRARQLLGADVSIHNDYREILDQKDISTVLIATPDHWHAEIFRAAALAGKHIYCECPLGHTLEEGTAMAQAEEDHQSIVQVGTAQISSQACKLAREMIDKGELGKVYLISGNFDTDTSVGAWQAPYPPNASPDTVDWKTFEQPLQDKHDFDLARFFRWRCYWDYGSGLPGDRFADYLAVVQWAMNSGPPEKAMASGGLYRWKDGRETPDVFHSTFTYPEGFMVSLRATQTSSGGGRRLSFFGTDATLVLDPHGAKLLPESKIEPYEKSVEAWPTDYRDWFYMMHDLDRQGRPRRPAPPRVEEEEFASAENEGDILRAHVNDFIAAVRARKPATMTARKGFESSIGIHLANLSYREQRPVGWDRQKGVVTD